MAPSLVSTASTATQGPVTLALFKLSHCTSPSPYAKAIWYHHPQRSDMFAVFDVIRKVGTGLIVSEIKVLKLVRGGELLEQVELPNLQDQVRMDEERTLSQHVPDNLLHVLVIVKRPLLALRYSQHDGQIRKIQMNFVPNSGCDVALETFRAAGLPIRDKDMPQVQSQGPQSSQSQPRSQERSSYLIKSQVQHPQSSQSQPHSLERLDPLNAHQAARSQSSQDAFQISSQPLSKGTSEIQNLGYDIIPPSTRHTKSNIRSMSATGGANQAEFSRPISGSSRAFLNAVGSTITVTSMPVEAQPIVRSGLLPSPTFNRTYETFGGSEFRPMSAPDRTQAQQLYTNTLPLSQMPPPERTFPFPEERTHLFGGEETVLQEEHSHENPTATKTKAKRQPKPRAQPAKPRKSRAKAKTTNISSDPLTLNSGPPKSRAQGKAASSNQLPGVCVDATAPSSSAPQRMESAGLQALPPVSEPLLEPPSLTVIGSRKRSLADWPVNQSNKRQAQTKADTVTGTMTETMTQPHPEIDAVEHILQGKQSSATDPLINISSSERDLLDSIDSIMLKCHEQPVHEPPSETIKEHLAEDAVLSDEDWLKNLDNLISRCDKDEHFNNLINKCNEDENFEKLMKCIEGAWKTIGLGF